MRGCELFDAHRGWREIHPPCDLTVVPRIANCLSFFETKLTCIPNQTKKGTAWAHVGLDSRLGETGRAGLGR